MVSWYKTLKLTSITACFSGLYFPAFGLNTERYSEYSVRRDMERYSVRMRENTGQKNSEYGHFSRSVWY